MSTINFRISLINYSSTNFKLKINLPSVVKTSTSHKLKEPSTPTNCRKTYWPINGLAQVNVLVMPSSEKENKYNLTKHQQTKY